MIISEPRVKAWFPFLISHLIKQYSDIDTTYRMQFSSQNHNNIPHQCQDLNGNMLTTRVSDTDWDISPPFGNMIPAVPEKSPLPTRTEYMKCITLAGQMNGIISFYFRCSFPNFSQHSSSTRITIVNVLNLLICSNEQLNHWHTSCIISTGAILLNYTTSDIELLRQLTKTIWEVF